MLVQPTVTDLELDCPLNVEACRRPLQPKASILLGGSWNLSLPCFLGKGEVRKPRGGGVFPTGQEGCGALVHGVREHGAVWLRSLVCGDVS